MSTDRNAGRRAEVVLMCGVAGSGKTTYAKSLESDGFERLSIDEEIWRRFGRYGVDFAADDYQRLSDSVEYDLRVRLINLVRHGHDVVVDFSFWQRVSRDRQKELVESAGGIWRLVYLKVDDIELHRRLRDRNGRFDANAAFPITDELLEKYLESFEEPQGEGEEIRYG